MAVEDNAYPAVFHFRVIADADGGVGDKLRAALAPYRVESELAPSAASCGSQRFCSFGVSVRLSSRAEMVALDADLKRVAGVRMVL